MTLCRFESACTPTKLFVRTRTAFDDSVQMLGLVSEGATGCIGQVECDEPDWFGTLVSGTYFDTYATSGNDCDRSAASLSLSLFFLFLFLPFPHTQTHTNS